ncbi:hypothetical protein Tco_0205302 [Tanacetum coccineum]
MLQSPRVRRALSSRLRLQHLKEGRVQRKDVDISSGTDLHVPRFDAVALPLPESTSLTTPVSWRVGIVVATNADLGGERITKDNSLIGCDEFEGLRLKIDYLYLGGATYNDCSHGGCKDAIYGIIGKKGFKEFGGDVNGTTIQVLRHPRITSTANELKMHLDNSIPDSCMRYSDLCKVVVRENEQERKIGISIIEGLG